MSEIHLSEPRPAPRRPTIFAANALYLLSAAGLALLPWAVEPLAALLRRLRPDLSAEGLLAACTLFYYLPCAALPCLIYAGRRGLWDALRLTQPLPVPSALYAAMAAVVSLPLGANVALLWSRLLEAVGLDPSGAAFYIPTTTRGLALSVFYMGIVPGLVEELAFRGLALGAWERRGSRRALAVTSLLFAALHGSVAGFPTQLLLGFILGCLALGSGSIWAGMIFHTLYNSLILISEYTVQNLMPAVEAEAAAEAVDAAYLMHAGLDVLLLGLVLLFLVRRVWRRGAREGVRTEPPAPGAMNAQEALLLVSGVVTVLYLYGRDLLDMLGVLS